MFEIGCPDNGTYLNLYNEDDAIYIPPIEPCDECDSLAGRVTNLEECCADVWAKILDHDTRIETLETQMQGKQNILTPADNTIVISADTIRANLSNYYNKAQVDELISAVQGARIEVVSALPATGESNVIYLVPNQGQVPDVYDEYIYINGNWELIGSTDIDLSGYVTDSELTAALSGKADTNAVVNVTRNGTTFTATRADGTTFTFTQQDNNTWQANTVTQNGYVTAPSATNTYKIWGTNDTGAPAWRNFAGSATPVMDGTASAGSSYLFSRQDHKHPTDTTRAPLASPTFTGTPKAPSATAASTNTTQIATTAFVQTVFNQYRYTNGTYTETCSFFGWVTSGGNHVVGLAFLPKIILGKTVSITAVTANIRAATGGYVGATGQVWTSRLLSSETHIGLEHLGLTFNKSDGWGITNNTPCTGTLEITFTVS